MISNKIKSPIKDLCDFEDRMFCFGSDGGDAGSDAGGGDNDAVEAEATTGTTGGGNAGVGGLGPGGGHGSMNDSDSSVTGMSSADIDLAGQMAQAGMSYGNPAQRAMARMGVAMGLPPDPALASHSAVMGGFLSPVSLATGVPMGSVLDFVQNPSMKAAGRVAAGTVAGPLGVKGYDMAFGVPSTTPTSIARGPVSMSAGTRSDNTGNESQITSILPSPKKNPTTESNYGVGGPQLVEYNPLLPYDYNRSWWQGNKFILAPISRGGANV